MNANSVRLRSLITVRKMFATPAGKCWSSADVHAYIVTTWADSYRDAAEYLYNLNRPLFFCRRCVALSNKVDYTKWTEDDLLYVKERNIVEYRNIRRQRDRLEDERRKREFEQTQIEQMEQLERERKEHELLMERERQKMLLNHETQIEAMRMDTERRTSAFKKTLDSSRRQHSVDMEERARQHQEKLHAKKEEIARLEAEKEELETDFEHRYSEQQHYLSEKASEVDSQLHQAWADLDRKMKERSSLLEAKLAESQAKFEEKLEKQRKIMEKEAEEAFTSRVTTELEVEKADGSRVKLSETTPGYVAQLATNFGLFSESDDQSMLEDL